jgi:hypothetical protein
MFQPSQGFSRPHTTSTSSTGGGRNVSRGVAQSKHELAKALNSNKSKSTLHLTNLIEDDDDDDAPYDLGLGGMDMGLGSVQQSLKKVSSTSRLKELPAGGMGEAGKHASRGMKRPQSMAAMRRKKKDMDF